MERRESVQPTLLLMLLKKRKQSKRPLAGSGTAAIDWVTGSPPVGALIKAEGYGSFSNDTSLIPAAQRATCLTVGLHVRRAGGVCSQSACHMLFVIISRCWGCGLGTQRARWLRVPGKFL